MKNPKKPKKKAKELGIDPEQIDFIIEEKELENVSGGAHCGEIGLLNPNCSKAGMGSGCENIGNENIDFSKVGM